MDDAFEYFSKPNHYEASFANASRREDSVKIYDKYSPRIAEKLNELKDNPNVDDERANDINNSGKLVDEHFQKLFETVEIVFPDDLRSAISGKISFDSLCLKCLRVSNDEMDVHPFFEGSLCKDCSVWVKRYSPGIILFLESQTCLKELTFQERYKPCMFVFGNDSKCVSISSRFISF